ncbi:MAG: CRISPR-associated helicase Cas3' [Hyphomonadaceae bacterium]|nr:CRISPR-associated helicase Cas3' [Hyphomonadaceae bacterium]
MVFETFFEAATRRGIRPYPYQLKLAHDPWPETLIVPTGFGKTAAVLGAWLWKLKAGDPGTPKRLVYCLPMRTLVEQTEAAAKTWIAAAKRELDLDVRHDVLIGGRSQEKRIPDWIMRPDEPAILIGTQDLLVSAALMRGYAVSRFRWPVDFALLHNDALWVFDEVQLTGATLATSAQLEAFRRQFKMAKNSRTLWMSATLDPAWLRTVDFKPADVYRSSDLSKEDIDRARHLWSAGKTLARLDISERDLAKKDGPARYATTVAKEAAKHARPQANMIVFLNTVARAQAVFKALQGSGAGPEPLLIHSRFRAAERRALTQRLNEAPPSAGRIVVATQALEAGVDVTSVAMLTEIAPWSSLVQRFGRCNRYGECKDAGADIFWIDLPNENAAPYEAEELDRTRETLAGLVACSPANLAEIHPSAPERGQVIRKRDLLDLFDTDPDLSGFDVDISVYVRDAQDTDVRLFWRPVDEGAAPPSDAPAPERDELCPAPIGSAKELVKRAKGRAWRWDALAKEWRSVGPDDLFPGLLLWIDAAVGGYDERFGFDASSKEAVEPVELASTNDQTGSDDFGGEPDSRTQKALISLARHSVRVRGEALSLAEALGLSADDRALLAEAALHHDWGKAHEAFVALTAEAKAARGVEDVLAKWPSAPKGAKPPEGARRYFRHELASALAYLETHAWRDDASLAAYLIAAHHGKVRMRLRALPKEKPAPDDKLFARGVHDGDSLPQVTLGDKQLPETKLDLDIMQLGDSSRCGASWSARTQRLLEEHGPFRLAWLEALLRIADWRASAEESEFEKDDL